MGSRLVKPPPLDRPLAPPRGQNNQIPRPFPMLTPQSYMPGGAGGGLPSLYPGPGASPFPTLGPNAYLPPPGTVDPPIMNYSSGTSLSPGTGSFPSMYPPPMPSYPPPMPSFPPPMPYPNQSPLSMMPPPQMPALPPPPPPPMYDPGYPSYPRRRPGRYCRPRRSRRCRPVIHIIDSDSCSSISTCRSASPCSRRRRSRSCSRRRAVTPQQQQPIIVLPVQCQQPAATTAALPAPMSALPQSQAQQIVLPPIQVQQPGQFSQQPFGLSQLQIQPMGGSMQPQTIALSSFPMNSSNMMPNTSSSPVIISNGQSFMQSGLSTPQIASIGPSQTIQGGAIQYVQNMPRTSSPLQYVKAARRSTGAPSHVLVNSTNKKPTSIMKPVQRSASARDLPQMDLRYGRRPFDWYKNTRKDNIIDENIHVAQR